MGNETLLKRCDALKTRLEECEAFAAEINLADEHIQSLPISKIYSGQFSLKEKLGHKRFEKYERILKKAFQVDLRNFNRFPPLIITQVVSESVMRSVGIISVDNYLWQMAGLGGLERGGVESYQEQYEIMMRIPIELQVSGLKSIAGNVNKFRKEVLSSIDLYYRQDIRRLYLKSKKQLGGLRKLLLYSRNQKMTQRIDQMCTSQSNFVVVGAAHLDGKYGILRLLKQNGLKVEPVHHWF